MKRFVLLLFSMALFLVLSPPAISTPVKHPVKKETVVKDSVQTVLATAVVLEPVSPGLLKLPVTSGGRQLLNGTLPTGSRWALLTIHRRTPLNYPFNKLLIGKEDFNPKIYNRLQTDRGKLEPDKS